MKLWKTVTLGFLFALAIVLVLPHRRAEATAPSKTSAVKARTPALNTTPVATTKVTLHDTVYHIVMRTALEGSGCTATAVGPHALLTAAHCELGTDNLIVGDTSTVTAHIVKRLHDEHDHTIFLLDGIGFKTFADFTSELPQSGQHVFMWGNPQALRDMYREGYMSGIEKPTADKDSLPFPAYIFDINIDHGDSGAAVFNSDGRIVGVLSFKQQTFAGTLALSFTPDQLREARTF